jgi:thymidine phosphorylase
MKVQMNSLVPESISKFVEEVHEATGVGKSDLMHLFVSYFKTNFTMDEIKELTMKMLVLGEQGIRNNNAA